LQQLFSTLFVDRPSRNDQITLKRINFTNLRGNMSLIGANWWWKRVEICHRGRKLN
jgi:hypothetical protein